MASEPWNQTYTPVAYFSSVSLQDHNAALENLAAVKRSLALKMEELCALQRNDKLEAEQILVSLTNEERELTERLRNCRSTIQRLEDGVVELDTASAFEAKEASEETETLENDLLELEKLEQQLKAKHRDVSDRQNGVLERKSEFVRRSELAVHELDRLRGETKMAATDISRIHVAPPAVVSRSPSRRVSPPRTRSTAALPPPTSSATVATSAVTGSRISLEALLAEEAELTARINGITTADYSKSRSTREVDSRSSLMSSTSKSPRVEFSHLSPKRHGKAKILDDDPTAPVVGSGANVPSRSPRVGKHSSSTRSTADQSSFSSMSAVRNDAEDDSDMSPAPGATDFHTQISSGNIDTALAMLRARSSLVNTIDGKGNTPLHVACSTTRGISLELINSLLLAGAKVDAKNDDGLTPFHCACLNAADFRTHSLKKFLIFKAGVSPNERTSRGETVAHLLVEHDSFLESLKYLSTVALDLDVKAMSPCRDERCADDGAQSPSRRQVQNARPITALEKAKLMGVVSARTRQFLESMARKGTA